MLANVRAQRVHAGMHSMVQEAVWLCSARLSKLCLSLKITSHVCGLVVCAAPVQGVGWILAVAFFVDSVLVGTALQRMTDCCVRTGIKIRSALMSEVWARVYVDTACDAICMWAPPVMPYVCGHRL